MLFAKYELYKEQVIAYERMTRLYEINIKGLNQEIIAYDSLVKVLDRKLNLSAGLFKTQELKIRTQDKTIRRLKVGIVGTLTVFVITAILQK